MPSPLPPSKWPAGGKTDNVYRRLVELEHTKVLNQPQDPTIPDTLTEKKHTETSMNLKLELIQVRVMGHLMHVAPAPWGDRLAAALAPESADSDSEWGTTMRELAEFYIKQLFRLLRTDRRPHTPTKDSRPSPGGPSFDAKRREIEAQLDKPPGSREEAKQRALVRDGYRCVLTGRLDLDSLQLSESRAAGQSIAPGPAADPGPEVCLTQCCHIFSPRRTADANIDVDVDKVNHKTGSESEYAASARAVLDRMAPDFKEFFEELNRAGIHRLENVMTMDGGLHAAFGMMIIWLEPEDADADADSNTYRVCYEDGVKDMLRWYGMPETITFKFSTPDAHRLPVPARRYLQLRGVCTRVAHLSGAAEYVRDVLDRVESGATVVLTEDGSDVHVLARLLAADAAAY